MSIKIYDNNSDTPTVTGTVETVAPDKSHTIVSISGQEIETISIGDTTYVKLGGTWQKTSGGITDQLPPISGSDILQELGTPAASSGDVKKTGEETISGVNRDVYEFTASDSTTTTFWIGHNDHLPYKITSQVDTTRTEILFSDFNSNITIEAPI